MLEFANSGKIEFFILYCKMISSEEYKRKIEISDFDYEKIIVRKFVDYWGGVCLPGTHGLTIIFGNKVIKFTKFNKPRLYVDGVLVNCSDDTLRRIDSLVGMYPHTIKSAYEEGLAEFKLVQTSWGANIFMIKLSDKVIARSGMVKGVMREWNSRSGAYGLVSGALKRQMQ